MTEDNPPPAPSAPPPMEGWFSPGRNNVQLVYILYLVGFVVPFTPIIGLVFAYVNRGQSEGWIDTHYTWAIRTFWIGLLGWAVSLVLFLVVIGILAMLAMAVWYIVRCVVGLQTFERGEPIKNPKSWMV